MESKDPCKVIRIALILSIVGLIATSAALVIALVTPGSGRMSFSTAKEYTSELVNNELYARAVEEYSRILEDYDLSDREAAALLYNIGDLSAEHLGDHDRALAAFLEIRKVYPETDFAEKAEKRIIEEMEKSGRSGQAQRLLEESVQLGIPASEADPSQVVAKIGNRVITSDELESAFAELPAQVRANLSGRQAKTEFLRSYVGQRLMADAALREGYDRRPEVQKRLREARRGVLASIYYRDKIAGPVDISAGDVDMYYETHKGQFGGAPLEQVRGQVEEALRAEKTAGRQSEEFERLLAAEDVQLYPENLRVENEPENE